VKQKRINELILQFRAMKEGFFQIVPYSYISNYSIKDLKERINGTDVPDMNYLESITRYIKYIKDDQLMKWFWDILKNEFSDEDKKRYLLFTTGQSRLSLFQKTKEHCISRMHESQEKLPEAHVCFFQIGLPEYNDKETMKKKLLQAIYMEGGIKI